MSLGEKIAENRKRVGLSQEDLGFQLNVSRQSISLWETNQAQPTLSNLVSLAKIFGVSIDELCDNQIETKTDAKAISQPLQKAVTIYDENIYKKAHARLNNRYYLTCCICILSLVILVAILGINNKFALIPLILLIIIVASIVKTKSATKNLVASSLKQRPNLKMEYLFGNDHFDIISKSDNSYSTYSVQYSDLKYKSQDDNYIYCTFDNMYCVIDKQSCDEQVLHLLGLAIPSSNSQRKTKALLLTFFILSIASILIALMIVVICINASPIPDFPLAIAEYMWIFFLLTPITITSTILGIVMLGKGFKCKKNIIAGIIMTLILCIYGSFTNVFAQQISHDTSYLEEISQKTNIEFPNEYYISIAYDFVQTGDSFAMAKFDKDDLSFVSAIKANPNWHNDASFIPSTTYDIVLITLTSQCEYYAVYNLTTNSYDDFDGKIIYFAFDTQSNILYNYVGH